jgi:predicted nucleic acid-binding protein
MGDVGRLGGKSVYLDTNVIVYAVEGFDEHQAFLEALFRMLDAGEATATTSELTLAEVLVKPFKAGRHDIIELYEDLLQSAASVSVLPVDRQILINAARFRIDLRIKLPDAIHVATAVAGGCDIFLTNDRRIRLPSGLELHTLG